MTRSVVGFVRIAPISHRRGTNTSQGVNQMLQSGGGDLNWGDKDRSGGKRSDLACTSPWCY